MTIVPFDLHRPARRETSVIFASPHSGRDYPAGFLRRSPLSDIAIRSSEDAFVDLLFDAAPASGAPLLSARTPRAWLDVNRAADELDPALIEGVRRGIHNPRVASGLGVIPRVVAGGRAIYRGKIPHDEASRRIRDVWRPYHGALRGLMTESLDAFGRAILVDCHSMPHEAIEATTGSGTRPDIVLGDRYGAAAADDIVERIEAAFASAGLRVARNAPFAGAYVTQAYGRPSRQQHVVQVEIDRALYMNEATVRPLPGFHGFKAMLDGIVADIAAIGRADVAVAAE